MKPDALLMHPSLMRIAVILLAGFALIGVVMAQSHDPVAIEPDAPRGAGVGVATFALG